MSIESELHRAEDVRRRQTRECDVDDGRAVGLNETLELLFCELIAKRQVKHFFRLRLGRRDLEKTAVNLGYLGRPLVRIAIESVGAQIEREDVR